MRAIIVIAATLATLATPAFAETREIYGPAGQHLGNIERGIGGEQRYYGPGGEYLGHSDTSRATGDTQYYGPSGRYLGEARD